MENTHYPHDPQYLEVPMLIRLAVASDIQELRYPGNQSFVREEYRNSYKLKFGVNYLVKDLETGAFKNYCSTTDLHTSPEDIKRLFREKRLYVIANDFESNPAFAKAKKTYPLKAS